MGIELIFIVLLAALFAVAAITCHLERKPWTSLVMSFTAIMLVGAASLAVL